MRLTWPQSPLRRSWGGGDPDGIPLVSEFEDVFRTLQGIPPDRADPFIIEWLLPMILENIVGIERF